MDTDTTTTATTAITAITAITRQEVEDLLLAGRTPAQVAADTGLDYDEDEDAVVLVGWLADDGGAEIEYPHAVDGEAAAREYVGGGDWGVESTTTWVHVWTWRVGLTVVGLAVDDAEIEDVRCDEERHTIAVDPPEPACTEGEHGWRSVSLQGHGGGVQTHEVCAHCGVHRHRDTWATDPQTGKQGLDSVRYEATRGC